MRFAILAVLAAGSALTAPLNILNASFETATLPFNLGRGPVNNPYTMTFPTGGSLANWGYLGDLHDDFSGALSPTAGGPNWTTAWYNGNNIGYVESRGPGPSALVQTLSDTLQTNTTYSLSALIGRPTLSALAFNYSIELWAGATQLGSASNLALGPNSSGADTLTVIIGASHAEAGQPIQVRLSANGFNNEAYFDMISGTSTATGPDVPEPAGYALLGAGLVLLAALRCK